MAAAAPTTQHKAAAAAEAEAEADDDYDNPRFSSAAQCIRFRMLLDERDRHEDVIRDTQPRKQQATTLGSPISATSPSFFEFAPEFTHQVFPGEWISGYQPMVVRHALLSDPKSHEPLKPHRSFGHHILATHEVRVDVALAPDCATCRVTIRTAPLPEEGGGDDGEDKTNNSVGLWTGNMPVGQWAAGSSAKAVEWRRKRPRRHASMIADKRMKRQSQDDEESGGSDESEGEPPADGTKELAIDANGSSGNVNGLEADLSASSVERDKDGEDVPASEEEEEESDSYAASSGEPDDEIDNEDDGSSNAVVNDNNRVTQSRRMKVAEIREALAKALPPMVAGSDLEDDDDGASRRGDRPPRRRSRRVVPSAALIKAPVRMTSFLSEPIGTVVGTPFKKTQKGEDGGCPATFVLALADGADARVAEYHGRVQRLATWFIETADEVNVAHDKGGGYWKILYLFRRHGGCDSDENNNTEDGNYRYSLAGYMTLYHFRSPFRKPKPGIVVRICQVLVLPPYQRMGLGRHMLNSVYDTAEDELPRSPSKKGGRTSNEESIVEFNVEDPAPAFAALRNRVDFERFGALPWFTPPNLPITDESYFSGLSDAQANEAAARLRITSGQVHVVHELVKLRALNEHLSAATEKGPLVGEADELQRRYRLMVKKRLNRDQREDLGGRTKPEAQRVLGELFDECHLQYQRLLGRVEPYR